MATFIQEEKKQKILIFIFIASVLIIFIIIWLGFHKKIPLPSKKLTTPQIHEIKIDWQIFENSDSIFRKLEKKFQPFERIKEFEDAFGRENPFVPY